jgi:hypothetical protein
MWDEEPVSPTPPTHYRMAKVKLELHDKTDEELRVFATDHQTQITDNPHFTTPDPSPGDFDPKLAAYSAKMDAISTADFALKALRAERKALRVELETALNARGSYVEKKSGGDPAKILSAGFEIVAAATPTSSLPAPENVKATMGDKPGEIDIASNAVPKAKSYIYECREHEEGSPAGAWTQVKVSTRRSFTAKDLVSGKRYAFRMKALGPNDLESAWSDEAVCMAP